MIKETLIAHAEKYPLMKPTDAVKLIYQNEFGPGHLIADKAKARVWLEREYSSASQNSTPLLEDIGNGLVRVNLRGMDASGLSLDVLFDAFCRSADEVKGSVDSFEKKLTVLIELTEQGIFPFNINELNMYLREYKAAGYPPVSHSHEYRDNYNPAYRVVLRRYIDE